jgi:Clostripain family
MPDKEPNNWTIMVYLAGDNNLAEEMVYALKCMDFVGSYPPDYQVIALYDAGIGPVTLKIAEPVGLREGVQPSSHFLRRGEKAKEKAILQKARDAKREFDNASQAVRELDEKDQIRKQQLAEFSHPEAKTPERLAAAKLDAIKTVTANAFALRDAITVQAQTGEILEAAEAAKQAIETREQAPELLESVEETLKRFVAKAITEHPAKNYMLVLSGHGSGAVGDFLTGNSRFFGLSIPGLRQALAAIRKEFPDETFPVSGRKTIDILGMDSCLMGMSEVAYEVREYVHFLVGAEGFEPNTGWPYDRIINLVKDNSNITAHNLAERIVHQYIEYYASDYTLADVSTDQCALDLTKINSFVNELGTAEGLSTLLKRVLADPETQERIAQEVLKVPDIEYALRGTNGLSNTLAEVFSVPEIQEIIEKKLGGDEGLSSLLIDILESVKTQASIVTEDRELLPLLRISVDQTKNALKNQLGRRDGLSSLLKPALAIPEIKDAIVLAHWEAQGYKNEQHIDVLDFCHCLSERLEKVRSAYRNIRDRRVADVCDQIIGACERVQRAIEPKKGVVLESGYCGPEFQHSHGISIFFPWANMTDARGVREIDHYGNLEFARDSHWDEFISAYHERTQRPFRPGKEPDHVSRLNRRDGLFTPKPGKVGTELSARIGTELSARIGTELSARVGTELSARIGTELSARIGTELSARIATELSARVGTELSARVGTELSARVGTELSARVGTELSARVGTELSARVGTELSARVGLSSGGGAFPKIASMKNPPIKWANP